MTRRTDHELDTSLSSIDEGGASAGFTSRVMATLAARRERRRKRRRQAATAAAAAVVVAALALPLLFTGDGTTETEIASEKELLLQEHARLESALDELRSSARESAPVLYLGGNDELDLVLDLASIVTRSAPATVSLTSTDEDPFDL